MACVIPAFATALQDRRLRGAPRDVYVWMHEHLDVVDYRPVKHAAVEAELAIKAVTVARSIERLLSHGYISRGDRDGKLWTYRLIYSRPRGQS